MGQKLESIPKMTKKGGIVKSRLELDKLFRLAHHISDISDNIYYIIYSIFIVRVNSETKTIFEFQGCQKPQIVILGKIPKNHN